jgi:hypothetical protein
MTSQLSIFTFPSFKDAFFEAKREFERQRDRFTGPETRREAIYLLDESVDELAELAYRTVYKARSGVEHRSELLGRPGAAQPGAPIEQLFVDSNEAVREMGDPGFISGLPSTTECAFLRFWRE